MSKDHGNEKFFSTFFHATYTTHTRQPTKICMPRKIVSEGVFLFSTEVGEDEVRNAMFTYEVIEVSRVTNTLGVTVNDFFLPFTLNI